MVWLWLWLSISPLLSLSLAFSLSVTVEMWFFVYVVVVGNDKIRVCAYQSLLLMVSIHISIDFFAVITTFFLCSTVSNCRIDVVSSIVPFGIYEYEQIKICMCAFLSRFVLFPISFTPFVFSYKSIESNALRLYCVFVFTLSSIYTRFLLLADNCNNTVAKIRNN